MSTLAGAALGCSVGGRAAVGDRIAGVPPPTAAAQRCRRVGAIELFEVEARDGLRLVVFGDGEVVAREAADDRSALVAHDDVDQDELGAGAEHRRRLRAAPARAATRPVRSEITIRNNRRDRKARRETRSLRSQRAPRFFLVVIRTATASAAASAASAAPRSPDRRSAN